jgi:hypothetical protein
MPQPIHDDIAQSILAKEKRGAEAMAVLNRSISAVPTFIVTMLFVGLGTYLQSVERFEAPLWVRVLLIAGFGCSVANIVDSWTTRRRLDAVITLLLQQEKNRTP